MKRKINRLTGAKDLVFDAVEAITNLVERTHGRVSRKTFRPLTVVPSVSTMAQGVEAAHDLTASAVYGTIRGVNGSIRKMVDAGSAWVGKTLPETGPTGAAAPQDAALSDAGGDFAVLFDQAESALNAVCGDYLDRRRNGLDIGMDFRHRGRVLPVDRESIKRHLPDATGKICVFVHGLGCTERVWQGDGRPDAVFGERLRQELGFTPLYIRYNTGRHISENGRRFASLLSALWDAYPGGIEEIVLVGHSMGGLVCRSSVHLGKECDAPWVGRLRHVFCVGTPNLGAPLEKGANVFGSLLRFFKTAGTQVPAEILNARSAGIKDLRFGYTLDEEWTGNAPDAFLKNFRRTFPPVDGVGYHFAAATLTDRPEHPVGRLLGDLLVRIPSASGKTRSPEGAIFFHSGSIYGGIHHMELARHPQIYRFLRDRIENGPIPELNPIE